ncbi:MAG: TAXI family TRAP transporter solute-binding subunit [Thermoanaerobaculales bacterium]|nr:TAXI family TRAP transporter solute-binding subunit [Thermoanaerobaculales bacterium]
MENTLLDQDVGSSLPVPAIVAGVVAVVVVIAGLAAYFALDEAETGHEIVIATGSESGTYFALGTALARVLEAEGLVRTAEVLSTDGSVANMRLVGDTGSGVDLAFVQSDTPPSTSARLITPLYKEVLHILVARDIADQVETIYDFSGLRVAIGAPSSGTRQLAESVLRHFDVTVGEQLELSPEASAEGLVDGSVDAAFILTAIPSRLVGTLASVDAVRFLSLGDAQEVGNESDGLALVFPAITATTIPRSTYVRLPEQPVRTIAVSALLVARRDLDPDLVRSITAAIFEHRGGASGLDGDDLVVAQQIREDFRPGGYAIPFHDGAEAYYHREEPPFFVAYAEAISLGLTLLVGAYSGYLALREWMKRRMKNRMDAYLIEIEELAADLGSLSLDELISHRDALYTIRHRALSDLVSERVLADENFTIFQNHMRDEFAAIEARIKEQEKS